MSFFSRKNKDDAPPWPIGEDGEPVAPALLTTADTRAMETDIIVNKLRAYGIPVVTTLPGEGMVGMVISGQPRLGVGIYVPETMRGEAAELLEENYDNNDMEGDTE